MYIVAIDKRLDLTPDTRRFINSGFFGCRYLDNYRLLRIPHKDKRFDTPGVSFCELGFDISHMADVIYNTEYKDFHKNRFSSGNNLIGFPNLLREVLSPVIAIINEKSIDYINEMYSSFNIAEAVYLTGTFRKYKHDIDLLKYYLVKLRYKQIIPKEYMKKIMDLYPDELIKVM